MNKIALGTGLSAGLLAASLSAFAQGSEEDNADRRFYISPMASYTAFDGSREFDDAIGYQLSIGKILGRGTNLEIYGQYKEPEFNNGDAELLSYGINVLLFQWRNELPIYGVLGLGKGEARLASGDSKAVADQFDIGLGYMLGLGNWPGVGQGPALRFEARYRTDKYSAGEAETFGQMFGVSNSRTHHDGIFSLGLYVPLGRDPNAKSNVSEPGEPDVTLLIKAKDSDGDQIPDDMDACPGTPPGVEINAKGCEHDTDKDGVPNSKDACPGTPASMSVDARGCPPDGDGDGVVNSKDRCPNTPRGMAVLADGCALRGDCRLPSAGQRIDANGCAVGAVILKGVNFETASANLTPEAKTILDGVAEILAGASDIRIEVGGHTDSVGSNIYNRNLSRQRADSVKQYLVDAGVNSNFLSATGYGESQPLVSNETDSGRGSNRRVELKVLD